MGCAGEYKKKEGDITCKKYDSMYIYQKHIIKNNIPICG